MALVIEGATPTLQLTKTKCAQLAESLGMKDFPDKVWLVQDSESGKTLACRDRSLQHSDKILNGLAVIEEQNDAEQLMHRLGFDQTNAVTFDEARQFAQTKGMQCLFLVDGVRPAAKNGEIALNILAVHFVA